MATANSRNSFHLQWNNHLTNLQTLLEYLYNEQKYVDVTLSCSDGFIRAHKLVLSACSPYFDSVFRENPCQHPTVVLRGISLHEMQLIIEYMYAGSVDVPENELSALLEIANELHIKGLVQVPRDDEERVPNNKRESPDIPSKGTEELEMKTNVTGNESSNEMKENESEQKEESGESPYDLNAANEEAVTGILSMAQIKMDEDQSSTFDQNTNLMKFRYQYNGEPNMCAQSDLFCEVCNRSFLNKQNMKRHMQTHTGVKPHQCTYCTQSFLRLSHLQRHHRVHTGERPFPCEQCDKQFSRSDKLKQHVTVHHSGEVVPKQPKQRGRPRKVPIHEPLNLAAPGSSQKLSNEEMDTIDSINNVPSYQTLQQIYNISTSIPGISVVQ